MAIDANIIKVLTWSDIRENVLKIEPELSEIIDELNPGKEFLLV